jgi:hypothetical protein
MTNLEGGSLDDGPESRRRREASNAETARSMMIAADIHTANARPRTRGKTMTAFVKTIRNVTAYTPPHSAG